MMYSENGGDGDNSWLVCYLFSIVMVLILDCFRGMDARAAEILTNCIVFLGINYIINDIV